MSNNVINAGSLSLVPASPLAPFDYSAFVNGVFLGWVKRSDHGWQRCPASSVKFVGADTSVIRSASRL